tara:strand:+ start:7547 stop:7840 length:294 start_codon:yes stop_codon:yes gene_type:complete
MLAPNYILIHLVIVILSIVLSYIIYRYLKYDLIDISKFVKNDIENFTQSINTDMFHDETAYPILEDITNKIQTKYDKYFNKDTIDEELRRLQVYNRK